MARSPRLALLLAAALALAACQPPGGTDPTGPKRKPGASARPGDAVASAPPGAVPPGATNPPTGLPPGGSLISDAAGSLVTLEGVVRAPAGIISNNSGAIVANNGGGLITDNGAGVVANNGGNVVSNNAAGYRAGRYRLAQAADQKPFAGVRVVLQDAAGKPVPDGKGGAISAVTDANGRYRITTPLPARNLVAVVKLEEGNGALQAIVGRGGGLRRADVELVSTLTTGYILGKYVAGQADPLATLERLPPAIEADTRAKAAQALADGRATLPAQLTPASVATTVEALRAADKAFDAQMEAVKRLLVVAGQSDLGEGRPATQVLLSGLRGVMPAADGGFYLPAWADRRLWRVKPDGTLTRVAGQGGAITAADGMRAVDAGFGEIQAAAVDAQGRLVFSDADATCRLWRVEADGRLKRLAELGTTLVSTLACAPDGTTWLVGMANGIVPVDADLDAVGADMGMSIEAVAPDGTRTVAWKDFDWAGLNSVGVGEPLYVGPVGELFFLGRDEAFDVAALRIEAAAKRSTPVAPPGGGRPVAFDQDGTWYYRDAGGALRTRSAAGVDALLLATPPAELDLTSLVAVPAPGGGVYLSDYALVYLVKDGVATLKAGLPAADAGVGGPETSLDPSGFAVRPDGTLVVAEQARKRLITVAKDGTTAVLMGAAQGLEAPQDVGLDAAGRLYVVDGLALKVAEPGGALRTIYTHANPRAYLAALLVAPDGTAYLDVSENLEAPDEEPDPDFEVFATGDEARTVWKVPAGGTARRLFGFAADDPLADATALLLADGALQATQVVDDRVRLVAWDGGWKPIGKDWAGPGEFDDVDSPVRDAKGRVYYALADAIMRADPATGTLVTIAGPGGRVFLGTGVDDAVGSAAGLTFAPGGDLLFTDYANRQIKRVPAAKLE